MSELKPCPLCGGGSQLFTQVVDDSDLHFYVECNNGCVKTNLSMNERATIGRWNTRNDKAVIDEFLKRVRERWENEHPFLRKEFMDLTYDVYAEMFPHPITLSQPDYYEDDEPCGYCNRPIGEPHKSNCRQ